MAAADQALMLEKEPENEYDPNAIRIQTLSGAVLGYVPRDLTARFPYPVTFGHVVHLGQVPDSGLWGALVRSPRPSILSLIHLQFTLLAIIQTGTSLHRCIF